MAELRDTDQDLVPRGLRVAAAWAWRVLLIVGLLWVLMKIIGTLSIVLIPVSIALLLSALLAPAVRVLTEIGIKRGLAAAIVTISGLGLVILVLVFLVEAVIDGLPDLQDNISESLNDIRDWLVTGPPKLSEEQIDTAIKELQTKISENSETITSGALATATTLGHVITGMLLAIFTLIFFLYDGERIWRFALGFVPGRVKDRVDVAGRRGFATLVGYVRATVLVAFVDAIGIGVGCAIIGVPLALPLAALVFLGSFVPIVGALVTGLIAVLVALVTLGPVEALLVLGVVLAVQQLEGHVLQPLLMGRAVELHPLAVVLSITSGVVVGGITGALLAVPLVAVVSGFVRSIKAQNEAALGSEVDASEAEDALPPDLVKSEVAKDPPTTDGPAHDPV